MQHDVRLLVSFTSAVSLCLILVKNEACTDFVKLFVGTICGDRAPQVHEFNPFDLNQVCGRNT